MPQSMLSADLPLFGHPQQGLRDNKGRRQSRRGLRPSQVQPNCKAVEGVRSEATVSLVHTPTFPGIVRRKFVKGCQNVTRFHKV